MPLQTPDVTFYSLSCFYVVDLFRFLTVDSSLWQTSCQLTLIPDLLPPSEVN